MMRTGGLFDPAGAGGGEKEQETRSGIRTPVATQAEQKINLKTLIGMILIINWINLKLALLQVLCA
jgi:hypothetical protein